MEHREKELKQGIKLHQIQTDKFKTNLVAVFLTTSLKRETVTQNALISSVLRRGTQNMPSQELISKELEEMYGAAFDCGLDKTGDNQVLKFYLETINDRFLPQSGENMWKVATEKLLEIVFNPLIEQEGFKEEYVNQEKENVKQRIEAKIDNKAKYALDRCIEEMYPREPFGLYKFGYVEDLEKLNAKNLYQAYQQLIEHCKIDIFVSGILGEEIEKDISQNENIQKLQPRNPEYQVAKMEPKKADKENEVTESMDVAQGKLVVGLDLAVEKEELRYHVLLYNSILGGSANSKMFQNVREKAHLAYAASSSYVRYKNNIFINCGIEIDNYQKALHLIKEQIEAMKKGDFTEEEIENAKKGIISGIEAIGDEQDTQIVYYFGQELSQEKISIEEYKEKVMQVSKENILAIANKVTIDTIYFLKN